MVSAAPEPLTPLRMSEEADKVTSGQGSSLRRQPQGAMSLQNQVRKDGHVCVNRCRLICLKAQEASLKRKAYCLLAFTDTAKELTGATSDPARFRL